MQSSDNEKKLGEAKIQDSCATREYRVWTCWSFSLDLWFKPLPEIIDDLKTALKKNKEMRSESDIINIKGLSYLFPNLPNDENIRASLIDGLTKEFGPGTLSKEFENQPLECGNIANIFGFKI
jgi:hypothetical protein